MVNSLINKFRYLNAKKGLLLENNLEESQNSGVDLTKITKIKEKLKKSNTKRRARSTPNVLDYKSIRKSLNFEEMKQSEDLKFSDILSGSFNKDEFMISSFEERKFIFNSIPECDKPSIEIFPDWSITYLKLIHKVI